MKKFLTLSFILFLLFANMPVLTVSAGDTITISRDGYSKEFPKDSNIIIKDFSGFSEILIKTNGQFIDSGNSIYEFSGSGDIQFFGGDYNFLSESSSASPFYDKWGYLSKCRFDLNNDVVYTNDPVLLAAGFAGLDECPYVSNLISYDSSGSYTAAATSVIHENYFTLQCKFKSFDDKLTYNLAYCLPSNQYAKDLVSDLNGFLSGRTYTPIVSSSGYKKTYQKAQNIQNSVTFDYAIENWLYPETSVEQLVDGSYTAIFKVPYDKQELGTLALAGCTLSNISSYPNYQDRLVASGYVESITSYVVSVDSQQGPVHVFKYDDKLNYITNYQICQEVGSITEEINKEKEHDAYLEEVQNRAEENKEILDEKFLNDNMWKNGFNSLKDFVSSGLTYVSSFAALIGGFLSFMPPWFVGFLYSAMVASIVIGIIKIIRG